MLRKLTFSVVVVATLLGGCKKKDENSATTSEGQNQSPSQTPPAGSAAATAPKWEKVERVAFAKLQTLLPESLIGMKRTNLTGTTVPDGEGTYSEASAEYTGTDETSLKIILQDNPETVIQELSSKTTAFMGYPVVGESETSDEAQLRLLVGERFVVAVSATKLKLAQVKSVFQTIDLGKLASWKLEGIPK